MIRCSETFLKGRRMRARCLTVILALMVVAAADEKADDGKVSDSPPQEEERVESGSKADVSYKSDSPPKEKQYFLYYNPRAQERNAQIVGADEQG